MSVNHGDFFSSALDIIGGDASADTEIGLRNAGSRAYYALYHRAKCYLESKGEMLIRVESAGSHEALASTFAKRGIKSKSFAESLARHKRFRHVCDYNLGITITRSKLELYLAETKRLIDMVDRLD